VEKTVGIVEMRAEDVENSVETVENSDFRRIYIHNISIIKELY